IRGCPRLVPRPVSNTSPRSAQPPPADPRGARPMLDFRDRTIVIAGGAGGMGQRIAHRFVSEGATVVAVDIDTGRGRELADSLGDRCRFTEVDVTDIDGWQAVKRLIGKLGQPLGGLINTAGMVNRQRSPRLSA